MNALDILAGLVAAATFVYLLIERPSGLSEDAVRSAVARHTEQPLLGFIGEPRVNVLMLNLDLDGLLA